MKKIRVLFPYVEAGFGHIMTMRSICQTFRKKYGDKVEVVESDFYTETGNKHLIRYEQMMARQVKMYNAHPAVGHFANGTGEFFGPVLSSLGTLRLVAPFAFKAGVEHMRELNADAVFSTHWATNYYAEHLKNKPRTVMYCPDAQLNKLFEYHADFNMMSMPYGYEKALRKRKYNIHNMRMVPFLIRNEAFDVETDKKALRKKLGLPEDNFTVLLVEGAYGMGKTEAICKLLAKEHFPVTVIPVCGKNEALYKRLKALPTAPEVTLVPYGFTEGILELESASDLFCGKSGNMIGEQTFFGNPSIITNCSNIIEHDIADHYINSVGCAIKVLSPKKTVSLIKRFAGDPSLMEPYRKAAREYRPQFGSERAADVLWEKLKEWFPELANT